MGHSVTRYHDISCGHRVHGHESKCAHLHGHNYRVTFICEPAPRQQEQAKLRRNYIGSQPQPHPHLSSPLDDIGRVVDFSVIKTTLCEWLEHNWDHKFLLWDQDPLKDNIDSVAHGFQFGMPEHMLKFIESFVYVPFNPTAENMAEYLVTTVGPQLLRDTGAMLVACRVEETRKCAASFALGGDE